MVNDNTKSEVAIISFPWKSYAPYKFLSDVLKILEPISDKIVLIEGNTDRINITSKKVEVRDIGIGMHYLKDIRPTFYSAILWITKCVLIQIKTSLELIKARKEADIVIFYMAYPYYLLPLITSKVLRKKAVEVVTRSKPNSLLSKIIGLQDPMLFGLLDGVSPESKTLITYLRLEKYKGKFLPEGSRFIDTSRYTIKREFKDRKNVVGYIGRIGKEKGIIEFVRSIPFTLKDNKSIEFLVGGDGDLMNWVRNEVEGIRLNYNVKITITGWITEDLLNYLNKLKLLVLPSYSEGLPTIVLEAMACGTPVLATPVGAIPDVIKDGETGFILENKTPECIAKNVTRVLEYQNLDEIVKNARSLVEKEYTYGAAVERYRRILEKI